MNREAQRATVHGVAESQTGQSNWKSTQQQYKDTNQILKTQLEIYEITNDIVDSVDMSLSQLQETVKDKKAWHATVRGVVKSWTQLSD